MDLGNTHKFITKYRFWIIVSGIVGSAVLLIISFVLSIYNLMLVSGWVSNLSASLLVISITVCIVDLLLFKEFEHRTKVSRLKAKKQVVDILYNSEAYIARLYGFSMKSLDGKTITDLDLILEQYRDELHKYLDNLDFTTLKAKIDFEFLPQCKSHLIADSSQIERILSNYDYALFDEDRDKILSILTDLELVTGIMDLIMSLTKDKTTRNGGINLVMGKLYENIKSHRISK